ncbi:MAG: class I SAM-dependent methyltransferase [Dethiobacter sp.]|jgi:ubiquinone/menaquinone biosynthesis C-methylase UbiE|nr:MAG: class I SAM-dependent methyltransferase [Dethiobacter sp.]
MSTSIKEIIAQKWDLRASEYTERAGHYLATNEQRQAWLEILAEVIGKDKSFKVLDVGTGPGFLALLISELGHECFGVDISREMLKIAEEKAEKKGLRCTFIHGDAEKLPFDDETFDVVVNRHLLWTLPNPGKAIRDWVRVLKPRGKIMIMDGDWTGKYMNHLNKIQMFLGRCIITVTERRNAWNWKGRYKELESQLPFRGVDQSKIIALMEAAGLEIITAPSINKLMKEQRKALPLGYKLANCSNTMCYVVVGEKC